MAKPVVQAIVVCDHIYTDRMTGKIVLAGTFADIISVNFPTNHGNLGIYVALTDVSEAGTVRVVFRNENDTDMAFPLPCWKIEKPIDRIASIELSGNVVGLPMQCEGQFEFLVLWNDVPIGSRRINLKKLDVPGNLRKE
ncbi:MAG: hypothetical protein ABIA63_11285 [bacterium]